MHYFLLFLVRKEFKRYHNIQIQQKKSTILFFNTLYICIPKSIIQFINLDCITFAQHFLLHRSLKYPKKSIVLSEFT